MTTGLTVVKSELFNNVKTDFYTDENNNYFMTINQLALCLGYASTAGIKNIISRYEYLNSKEFSTSHKLCLVEGKRTVTREMKLFNEDGIYEITFLSKTAVAQLFRAWVRKVIKEIRQTGEYKLQQQPTFEYHMIECVKSINDNVNKIESDLNQFKQEVKTELNQLKQPKQLPQVQPKPKQPQKPQGDYYTTLYNDLRYSTAQNFYKLVNKCFEKIAKARNTSISDTEQYIYDFLYADRKNWNSMGKGLSLQMEQNNLIYSGWKYTCVPYSAILKQRYSTAVIDIMKYYEV